VGTVLRFAPSCLAATEGRLDLAVAAYNAGPGAVNGHVPDNGQTVAYVAKVMRRYAALRG